MNRLLMVDRSWLMAQGSGSRLTAKNKLALGPPGPGPSKTPGHQDTKKLQIFQEQIPNQFNTYYFVELCICVF